MAKRIRKNVVENARKQWMDKTVWLTVKAGFEIRADCVSVTFKFGRVILLLKSEGSVAWFNASSCREAADATSQV